jgi:endonuclease YncB( thermonuclease family)
MYGHGKGWTGRPHLGLSSSTITPGARMPPRSSNSNVERDGVTPAPRRYRPKLPSLALTALASLILVAIGLAAYRFVPALRPTPPDILVGVPQAPRPVVPARPAEEMGDDRLSPFTPKDFGHRSRFSRPVRIAGPFEPLRGDILTNEEVAIALDGLVAPPASAICLGGDKRLWACGLQARAALNGFVRGRELLCTLQSGQPQRKARDPGTAKWDCTVEGRDLALLLVEGGWAKPAPQRQDRAMLAARDAAQAAQRGLWDGDWNIVRVPEAAQ